MERQHRKPGGSANINFKCEICGKGFLKKRLLIVHMRKHAGVPQLKCTVPSCGRSFKKKSHLQDHIKYRHSNKRPFKCDESDCSYSAKTATDYRKHKKLHSDERPFACTNIGCPYSTAKKSNLTRHLKKCTYAVRATLPSECDTEGAQSRSVHDQMQDRDSTTRDHTKCRHPECVQHLFCSNDIEYIVCDHSAGSYKSRCICRLFPCSPLINFNALNWVDVIRADKLIPNVTDCFDLTQPEGQMEAKNLLFVGEASIADFVGYSAVSASMQAYNADKYPRIFEWFPASTMGPEMQQSPTSESLLLHQLQQPSTSRRSAAASQTNNDQLRLQQQPPNVRKEREIIWQGLLEWHEKQKGPPESQKILRQVSCHVTARMVNAEAEVKVDVWPRKQTMQLIPEGVVSSVGGTHLSDLMTVGLILQPCEALQSLTRVMGNGFVGCVNVGGTHINRNCTIQALILLYWEQHDAYMGFTPNDQPGFVHRMREVVQQQKLWKQASLRQGMDGMPGALMGPRQGGGMMQQSSSSGSLVHANLPPGVQVQMQEVNIRPTIQQMVIPMCLQQQQGNIPIGHFNPSGLRQGKIGPVEPVNTGTGLHQQGTVFTQEGNMTTQYGNMANMPHENILGQTDQSGMQMNIQAGSHFWSTQDTMPPELQHWNLQNMQWSLQSASISQSNLQQNQQDATFQQQQTMQQQQQWQGDDADDNLEEVDWERTRNLMQIQELQEALQAAKAKEHQLQQLLNSPQHLMNPEGPRNHFSMATGVQRMLRPPGPQGNNHGNANFLEQPGVLPFNRMMGSVQANFHMVDQHQQRQQPQFDDAGIFDLLK